MNRRGFTLVELMIVIGIIALLAGALIISVSGFGVKSSMENTKGLLERIRLAMDAYKEDFGDYPPDGFDGDEIDKYDRPIRGSQVLVYKLAWRTGEKGAEKIELLMPERQPGGGNKMVPANHGIPYLPLYDKEIGPGVDPEIIDPWGLPLHYDYTVGDKGAYQDDPGESYHSREAIPHKETDPRRKSKFSNTYDIWSHGNDGTTEKPSADDDMMLK